MIIPIIVAVALIGAPGVYVVIRPLASWAAVTPGMRPEPTPAAAPIPRLVNDDVPTRTMPRLESEVASSSASATSEKAPQKPSGNLIGYPVSDHSPSSGFGYRRDPFTHLPRFHAGLDLGQPCLDPAWASLDGVVVGAGMAGGYGNRVVLRHAERDGKSFATTYNHLSSITVGVGQKVKRGDVVGRIGSTGRSTACHMHFEVIVDGSYVDPLPYLTGKASTANLSRPVGSYMPSGSYTTATPTPSPSPSATKASTSTSAKPSAAASSASATPQETTEAPETKETTSPPPSEDPPASEDPPPSEDPPASPDPSPPEETIAEESPSP